MQLPYRLYRRRNTIDTRFRLYTSLSFWGAGLAVSQFLGVRELESVEEGHGHCNQNLISDNLDIHISTETTSLVSIFIPQIPLSYIATGIRTAKISYSLQTSTTLQPKTCTF